MNVPVLPEPFLLVEYDGPKNVVDALKFLVATEEVQGLEYVEGLSSASGRAEGTVLLLFRRRAPA